MKMLGSCLLSGLRSGLALPNSGCCGAGALAFSSPTFCCFGDGDCIFALIFASGSLSVFCGERCWPLEVRSGLRSLTILLVRSIRPSRVGLDWSFRRTPVSNLFPSSCSCRDSSEKVGFFGEERVFVGRKPWRFRGDSTLVALYRDQKQSMVGDGVVRTDCVLKAVENYTS